MNNEKTSKKAAAAAARVKNEIQRGLLEIADGDGSMADLYRSALKRIKVKDVLTACQSCITQAADRKKKAQPALKGEVLS